MSSTARHRRDTARRPDLTQYPPPVPAVAHEGADTGPAAPLQLADTQPVRTPSGEGPDQAEF
jgi:hypothetical protein